MIYLDNAASTPVLPQVREKLNSVLDIYGNPSSIHALGTEAKKIIFNTKDIISNKLGCKSDELYFTNGATMSNNLVLQGFNGNIYVSAIEHEDIQLMADNFSWKKISVDKDGFINKNELQKYVSENTDTSKLFSIQAANGEIGTIQNIKEISTIIHSYPNSFLHMDMTQYIPYYEINVESLGVDSLSMSGQKIGCIKGIGLLYVSENLIEYISPIIYGNQGLIGGTENVPGIACLGEAFNCLSYDNKETTRLRNMLINGLNGDLVGTNTNRLPNNVNIYFKDVESSSIVMLLSEYGICVSAGSACSSELEEPSSTLLAIGLDSKMAKSCVRFTLSQNTTEKEIEETIAMTNSVVELLRGLNGD